MGSPAGKDSVKAFWEADPCAARLTDAPLGTKRFFEEVASAKDALEPERIAFAEFAGTRGLDVLEIGVGLGTDFIRFARAGARAVGLDLTEAAVASTRRLLELEGVSARVEVGDAESLPFESDSFDVVYSWGVLHHTPDTARALEEVRRVLRPGGEARVMLYALDSPFALGVWLRQIARERRLMGIRRAIARGLESPGTQAFTHGEILRLFSAFEVEQVLRMVTPYDRRVLGRLASIGNHGWFHLVRARKPRS
jgi:SAM-dependent methyltransferase